MSWIVELETGMWLYSMGQGYVCRGDRAETATRYPSQRSAQRALQGARKRTRRSYPNAKITEVTP